MIRAQGKVVNHNDEDDDDEVLELKDRLAAYKIDSSPDRSEGKIIITHCQLPQNLNTEVYKLDVLFLYHIPVGLEISHLSALPHTR